ncbi:TPA: hypothetical protein N0F65_010557 [Lagenidium giganteum]|uniref:Uncharacterized protein n=1 Tax=Lagenidium giganteum TaxID=4803 RepID=A0AAV2YMS1_9STRA|nr:TPA: hypothetical protein N0F65_010557 [Lagenidium giganteum]
MQQLFEVLKSASEATDVCLYKHIGEFFDFKAILNELYKTFCVFSASHDDPGMVRCQVSPSDSVACYDIRRVYDWIKVTADHELDLLSNVNALPAAGAKAELVCDVYKNVLHCRMSRRNSTMTTYTPPTSEQQAMAVSTKKERVQRRKDPE